MINEEKQNEHWKVFVLLLQKIAKEKNITQKKIAEKTGLKQSNISRAFSLKYEIGLGTYLKIAQAIQVFITVEDKEEKTDLADLLNKAMDELKMIEPNAN